MKRNPHALKDKQFDLLIIGGGIYGACLAWEGASRGMSTALIEKKDFGCETSSNSLKTIHGGLRYLPQLDFKRMRESIVERGTLLDIAPHLVHPLPFLMPLYSLKKGPAVMAVGLMVNDLVGFDRNHSKDPQKQIPAGKIISTEKCRELFPQIGTDGLKGGAFWYDGYVYNSERLLLSFLLSAVNDGANVCNYMEALNFIKRENVVQGVRAKDHRDKSHLTINARLTINATGPWTDCLLKKLNKKGVSPKKLFYPSLAINVVTGHQLSSSALGLTSYPNNRSKKSRMMVALPWRKNTIVGTAHIPCQGTEKESFVTSEMLEDFIGEFNSCNAHSKISIKDIKHVYRGTLPAAEDPAISGRVELKKSYTIHDHFAEDGIQGLVSLVGVKYTTARDVAEKTIDLAFKKLGKGFVASETGRRKIEGGVLGFYDDFLLRSKKGKDQGDLQIERHLKKNYGSSFQMLLDYGNDNPIWTERVAPSFPIIKAEILHAIHEEMACTLDDVIFRRTSAGSLGNPGKLFIDSCARIMAQECRWNKEETEREIQSVEKKFWNFEVR